MAGWPVTPEEVLAVKEPGLLFGDPSSLKTRFHDLAKQWHPDVNPNTDPQVFQHIQKLYGAAQDLLKRGVWDTGSQYQFVDVNGHTRIVPYQKRHMFELGEFYVSDNAVTYFIDSAHRALFDSGLRQMRAFVYASPRMEKEVSRYLPQHPSSYEAKDGRLVAIVPKDPSLLLLQDVVEHCGGRLDPKHVAWICSSMLNIACYLNYAKVVHHSISPLTYFIAPATHSAALLGGWWYAGRSGKPVKTLPKRTFGVLPWKVRTHKVASRRTDLELVKLTCREILAPGAPKPMMDWLTAVANNDAIALYEEWGSVLEKSFGARRFTQMEVTPEQVYPVG